jgi:Flp pilus assembly protein TadD
MRRCVRVVQLVVTFLFLSNLIFGATIKTRDGKTISGDIQGLIVLKGEELRPSEQSHNISYVIVQGKDIASLDKRGLNTVPDAKVSVVVCSGSPTEDLCLGLANDWLKAGMKGGAEAQIARMNVTMQAVTAKNLTDTVMGDLTTVGNGHLVVPALTITTAKGPIKLPVEEVIKPIPSVGRMTVTREVVPSGAVPAAKGAKPEELSAAAKREQVNKHFDQGVALENKKLYTQAEQEYRAALQLEPDNPKLHFALGNILLHEQNGLELAASEYRTATRLQPDYADAHVNLGFALMKKGDLDGAIAEYRTAIRLQPGHAVAHANLGLALEKQGDRQAALEQLHTANLLDPTNSTISQQYERVLRLTPVSPAGGVTQSKGIKPAETIAAGSTEAKLSQNTSRGYAIIEEEKKIGRDIDALKIKCPELLTNRNCLLEVRTLLVSLQNFMTEGDHLLETRLELLAGLPQTEAVQHERADSLASQRTMHEHLSDFTVYLATIDKALETAK